MDKISQAKPETKLCTGCGVTFDFSKEFFPANRGRTWGLETRCRDCTCTDQGPRTKKANRKLRLDILSHYGVNNKPICQCCGEQRVEFLSLDHTNGNGNEERKLMGQRGIFSKLRRERYPEGYRTLCHSCNMSFGRYGYCPHKSGDNMHHTRRAPHKQADYVNSQAYSIFSVLPDGRLALVSLARRWSKELTKPELRVCTQCTGVFPFSTQFFSPRKRSAWGLDAQCRECHNAIAAVSNKRYAYKLRTEVLSQYGVDGKAECHCCGEINYELLALDHVEGGGKRERQLHPSTSLFARLRRDGYPSGYRTLCHNCNFSLGIYGYCPHKSEGIYAV